MVRPILDFARDARGNFAMMMAIVTLPVAMGAGLAVDIGNVSRANSQLQNAVDAAVLAIAREGENISKARAEEIARQMLGGNLDIEIEDVQIVVNGTRYELRVKSKAGLSFGALLGTESWPLDVSASADIAYSSYEIGLVLDTTGSMAGGKLIAMKEAVNGLFESMSAQVTDKTKLNFALVPFSTFVNVGNGYGPSFEKSGKQVAGSAAAWLDADGESPIVQQELPLGLSRFQLFRNMNQGWGGCVETRPKVGAVDYGTSDLPVSASDPNSLFVPAFAIDEEDSGYGNSYLTGKVSTLDTSLGAKRKKLKKYGVPVKSNGDIVDFGLSVVDPLLGTLSWTEVVPDTSTSVYGVKKGPNFLCESQPITPLTNDYKALKKSVDSLVAAGNTNIMEGVAWGMRALSPGEPFTQGKAETTGVEKILIVLTDGSNTFGNASTALGSIYSSYGYLVDGRLGITAGGAAATNTLMNERTLETCSNAKAAGMEIYTIRLEEPNVATGTMLKECASSPNHYFDVPTRSKLDEAFSKIRDTIVRVRISS